MELLSNVKSGYTGLMAAMSEISALNIKQMEVMAERQMESSKYVAGLGFQQMKAVTSIDSLESVKALPASTLEVGTKFAKKVVEEGKFMLEQGSSYKTDITNIVMKTEVAS